MAVITQNELGLGRVGLKKAYFVQTEMLVKEYDQLIGRRDSTNQTFETYKQLIGLAPAAQTDEDGSIDYDSPAPLFTQSFRPIIFTKGITITKSASFTDQIGIIKNMTPQIARSFTARRNIVAANLFNNGFTVTTDGMNSETLFSTSHSMGLTTGSNRPTTDVALSPLAMEQCWSEINQQKDPRGLPKYPIGKIIPIVPVGISLRAQRAVMTARGFAGTNDNDMNTVREKFGDPVMSYYLTSQTAWFAKASNVADHGLVMLDQMPYDVEKMANTDLNNRWAAYESYVVFWYDWHGTWGTAP